MAKSYPHRQTAIIALVCAAAVGGTIAYVHWQTPLISGTGAAVAAVSNDPAPENAIASTSDDWKSQFFGTAGTTTVLGGPAAPQASSDAPLTLTDQLSKDFFARYVQLQQNGFVGNQQLEQDTVDQTISDAVSAANQPRSYAMSDIRISAQTGTSALHAYGNAVASAFTTYMPRVGGADIATDALNQGDLSSLSDMSSAIAAYKATIQNLLLISVPQPLAQYDLDLVNSVSGMLFTSESLQNVQADPIQAMASLSNYGNIQDGMKAAFLNMKNYFSIVNVSFAPAEPGALFSQISP